MHFLFSGEGSTDFGSCNNGGSRCTGDSYDHGPMAVIVDQIVEQCWNYSLIEQRNYSFASKQELERYARLLKSLARKSLHLPGLKKTRETAYYYRNARSLALIATELEMELGDQVVAILFRDADGTASQGRGLWEKKCQSVRAGFSEQNFSRGVAMIPKPKSEAWFICALKAQPYQSCESLELRSGNDDSPNSLKKELAAIHGGELPNRVELNELVRQRTFHVDRISMPSFRAFKEELERIVKAK